MAAPATPPPPVNAVRALASANRFSTSAATIPETSSGLVPPSAFGAGSPPRPPYYGSIVDHYLDPSGKFDSYDVKMDDGARLKVGKGILTSEKAAHAKGIPPGPSFGSTSGTASGRMPASAAPSNANAPRKSSGDAAPSKRYVPVRASPSGYTLIEHTVTMQRKWISDTDMRTKTLAEAFYDADPLYDPDAVKMEEAEALRAKVRAQQRANIRARP